MQKDIKHLFNVIKNVKRANELNDHGEDQVQNITQ